MRMKMSQFEVESGAAGVSDLKRSGEPARTILPHETIHPSLSLREAARGRVDVLVQLI